MSKGKYAGTEIPEVSNIDPAIVQGHRREIRAAISFTWRQAFMVMTGLFVIALILLTVAFFHERPLAERFQVVMGGEVAAEVKEWQEDKATLWPLATEFMTTNGSLIYEICQANFEFARIERLQARQTPECIKLFEDEYENENKNAFMWQLALSNVPFLSVNRVDFDEESYKYDPIERLLSLKMYVEVKNSHRARESGYYGGWLDVLLYVLPVRLSDNQDRQKKVKYIILLHWMTNPWTIIEKGVIRK